MLLKPLPDQHAGTRYSAAGARTFLTGVAAGCSLGLNLHFVPHRAKLSQQRAQEFDDCLAAKFSTTSLVRRATRLSDEFVGFGQFVIYSIADQCPSSPCGPAGLQCRNIEHFHYGRVPLL